MNPCDCAACRRKRLQPATAEDLAIYQQIVDNYWDNYRKGKEMKLKPEQVSFLEGLLGGLDDLPDGAWQAVCCDLIESSGEFKGKDPHDVWLAYCKEQSI